MQATYSIRLINTNCGHHHKSVEDALRCRKSATEISNKSLIKGARYRTTWEVAKVINNSTGEVVPTTLWEFTSCRQCGKVIEQGQTHTHRARRQRLP